MTDKEKVIKGLEYCANPEARCSMEKCPYFNLHDHCWVKLERDALELLKEQEPHVLTLEEAEKAEYCVLEVRNESLLQFVHDEDGGYFSPSLNNLQQRPYFEKLFESDEHEDYNRRMRCWSALPSKEQRQAAEWND